MFIEDYVIYDDVILGMVDYSWSKYKDNEILHKTGELLR